MEIVDTEKALSRDIKKGDIINDNGLFFIVTDTIDEEYGGTFIVNLETGKMETKSVEELTDSVNNPKENVHVVSECKLYIKGYM